MLVAVFAGGVLKTVVKEGEGWQHPKGKDEVMGASHPAASLYANVDILTTEDWLRTH